MATYKVFETVEYVYEYEAESDDDAVEIMENDAGSAARREFIGVTERYAVLADADETGGASA